MEQSVRNSAGRQLTENRPKFRFMDLEIWRDAIEIGSALFDIADTLEARKLYRFAEQLRGAGLSMSNNIAEGSGSSSKREFYSFLNIARRSTFENANILVVLEKRGLTSESDTAELLQGSIISAAKSPTSKRAFATDVCTHVSFKSGLRALH